MRDNVVRGLDKIEHVLTRPGMWVGDTSVNKYDKWVFDEESLLKKEVNVCPALLKIFDEIISNSIDEGLRTDFKYANMIEISIDDGYITVKDNGRGISHEIDPKTKEPQAVIAFTNMMAGSNFEDDNAISIGTHGLGAALTNIMSTHFTAITDTGKKQVKTVCRNNMRKIDFFITNSTNKCGTTVTFKPDYKRFKLKNLNDIHIKLIHKRVLDLAVCYPEIKFKWQKRIVKTKQFKNYLELYNKPFEFLQTENFRLGVFTSNEFDQVSFVNGIETYEGGTHVEYVTNQITNQLREALTKKYKKFKIMPYDIKNHITVVLISNKIAAPKFRSQTKEYVTNPYKEYRNLLDIESNAFINKLLKNNDIIDPIIETYKLKQQAKEIIQEKAAKRKVAKKKVLSHIPANHYNPEKRQLFISEGGSAMGSLSKVRNPKIHGGYPLRGKPMNVTGKTNKKVLSNKELTDLMNIIGLELDEPNYDSLNYGQINILADADLDGYSIVGLLLNFFRKWPKLFDEKRIHVVSSPILKVEYNKNTSYYYSLVDYNKDVQKGEVKGEITYLKGLGSLTEEAYESMIHDPVIDLVDPISEEDLKMFDVVYGSDTSKRKEWLMK